ncbi:hypothetical protein M408DRAFT_255856 [Serendipita vermifera MAFF 305830]|uniref:Uncharacterized protein n=1 Tax=Serendipita vermifera MAFF 305830 TaxID=933852 RepID=A0A0C3BIB5_SERVB|nr:hypothetical protein M408DRAFT_255856 [Serendipita vermifera MAFF 305830]
MADGGYASQWTGYGSLAAMINFDGSVLRPPTPEQPFVYIPHAIPLTPPPLWSSPCYSAPSPPETASPMTPSASFASFSPITAFHSSPLSSRPSLHSKHPNSHSPVNAFRSIAPSSSSGSPRSIGTPERLPVELTTRPGPLVPQKAYNAPFLAGKKPMQIGFQFVGGPPGIPMRLLQDARALDLPIEGADSTPFSDSVASTITLRIWWPGYVQYSRRMTMRKATGLLMRSELAMAVSEVYKQFIEEGREDPKASGQAKWRVGRGRITVNDLVLLRMFQVSQGSWQADVRLETEK